jgi:hypothetical protein
MKGYVTPGEPIPTVLKRIYHVLVGITYMDEM